MIVALTGATGNMGQETLRALLDNNDIDKVRILVLPDDKRISLIRRRHRQNLNRIEIIKGNIAERNACGALVADADYVLHLAAFIPPHSDNAPFKAIECNQMGVKTLLAAIEAEQRQPKLIHISTMALYGNRNYRHPWGVTEDPLLVSPFDIYAATKLRGEFAVLESKVQTWTVIRQTAMLHRNMLSDNMSDGLMFHTAFNSPLEWVTAHDSGVLMARIIERDMAGQLGGNFWRKIFNLGSLAANRITGYDTLNDGFKLIGGNAKTFFRPNYNATRNFHGLWFYDADKLSNLFDYAHQSTDEYWREILNSHKYYCMARALPSSLISAFSVRKLLKDDNAVRYWYKHGDEARLQAYFGGRSAYEAIGDWDKFGLLCEGKTDDGVCINYDALREKSNARLIDHGFDINKRDDELTTADLRTVAEAHGGKLLGSYDGDMYRAVEWENQDGETFYARPFTVLRAGHWDNVTYRENAWDFDRLSRCDKIYAQIWYDSHDTNENKYYFYDERFVARMRDI